MNGYVRTAETDFLKLVYLLQVTGWGFTEEDGKPATVLQELRVQPVDYSSCLNTLSFDFKKFLSRDKLCAGHLNKSNTINIFLQHS